MMRAEHLEAIKTADKAYYEDDKPNLSDAAYDELRIHKTPRQAVEIEG